MKDAEVGWTVTHKCGHTVLHDLGGTPAGDRESRAAWLSKTPCPDCWIARNKQRAAEQWLRQKNAAELAVATRHAGLAGLPELTGSAAACALAMRARDAALARMKEAYTADAAGFNRDVLIPARQVTAASWWIGHHALSSGAFVPVLARESARAAEPRSGPTVPDAAAIEGRSR